MAARDTDRLYNLFLTYLKMFAHYIMNGKQRNAKQFPGTNNTLQIQEKKKHIGYIGWTVWLPGT